MVMLMAAKKLKFDISGLSSVRCRKRKVLCQQTRDNWSFEGQHSQCHKNPIECDTVKPAAWNNISFLSQILIVFWIFKYKLLNFPSYISVVLQTIEFWTSYHVKYLARGFVALHIFHFPLLRYCSSRTFRHREDICRHKFLHEIFSFLGVPNFRIILHDTNMVKFSFWSLHCPTYLSGIFWITWKISF